MADASGNPPQPAASQEATDQAAYQAWYAAQGHQHAYATTAAPAYAYPPAPTQHPTVGAYPGYPPPPPPSGGTTPGSADPSGAPAAGAPGGAPAPPAGGYDYSQYYAHYYQHYPGYQYPSSGYGAAPSTAGAAPSYTAAYQSYPPPPSNGSAPPASYRPPPPAHHQYQQQKQPTPQHKAPTTNQQTKGGKGAPWESSAYNAVPPPSALAPPSHQQHQYRGKAAQRPMMIRPQGLRPAAAGGGGPTNALASAFQAAAAAISSGRGPGAQGQPQPVYRQAAGGGGAPAAQPAAMPPQQQWPPALKAYVERAFKSASSSQRAKLQEVLKTIISDAQTKGELWMRDWDTLPLPDLSQTAADAAGVIVEVASVSAPAAGAGAPSAGVAGGPTWAERVQQMASRGNDRWRNNFGGKNAQDNNKNNYANANANKQQKRTYSDSNGGHTDSEDERNMSHTERVERQRAKERSARFGSGVAIGAHKASSHAAANYHQRRRQRVEVYIDEAGDDEELDWDAFAIKGSCQELEKSYFRLTSAPHPSTVRPEGVLKKALARLVKLVAEKEVNYFYAQDQFKGMRQDCVVQNIRGETAVRVYEAHARAALEYGDVAEYNQCQSQIATLYSEGAPSGNQTEFLAYRILYQTVHFKQGEGLQLLNTLRRVSPSNTIDPGVHHALEVRKAYASEDYALFFKLYVKAPRLGRALMDFAVPRLRFAALNVMIKAFKPSLSVEFIAGLLGFILPTSSTSNVGKMVDRGSVDDGTSAGTGTNAGGKEMVIPKRKKQKEGELLPGCSDLVFAGKYAAKADIEVGIQDCVTWLTEAGAVLSGEGADLAIDCKASTGQLHMPEDKDAVAHGDANLDVGDFLKSFDAAG